MKKKMQINKKKEERRGTQEKMLEPTKATKAAKEIKGIRENKEHKEQQDCPVLLFVRVVNGKRVRHT